MPKTKPLIAKPIHPGIDRNLVATIAVTAVANARKISGTTTIGAQKPIGMPSSRQSEIRPAINPFCLRGGKCA